jgi:hypothetical protein
MLFSPPHAKPTYVPSVRPRPLCLSRFRGRPRPPPLSLRRSALTLRARLRRLLALDGPEC